MSPEEIPSDIVVWSRNFLAAFQQASMRGPAQTQVVASSHWQPPPNGVIKINVDAAFPPDSHASEPARYLVLFSILLNDRATLSLTSLPLILISQTWKVPFFHPR